MAEIIQFPTRQQTLVEPAATAVDEAFQEYFPDFVSAPPVVPVTLRPTAEYEPLPEPEPVFVVVAPPPPSAGSLAAAQIAFSVFCGLASFGLVSLILGAG